MSVPLRTLAKHLMVALLPVLLSGRLAYAQGPSLSLASGSTVKGSALSLNLSLNAGSSAPAGLQWTLSYAPSDISSLTMSAGSALTAAGKTLSCNAGTGSVMCLASGMNATAIGSGVVAVVTATLNPSSVNTLDSIPISNVMGALGNGSSVTVAGAGGTITVNNPVPTISTLSPANAVAGTAAFTLTVNGSGFVSGAVVNWNGANRTTTFVSATQLQAAITAADIATAGTAQVTVVNPSPGGGASSSVSFTITAANPVPTINSLSPASATAGTAAFTLTVNGSGFVNGAVVRWNGSNRTTTFVSATQLQAAIATADIATAGTGQVTVFNPAPGGGTSGVAGFTVVAANPVPTVNSLLPVSVTAGTLSFTLTVNGAGFIAGSVVNWNGSARSTTYVSATQLQAAITALDILTAGLAQVTVFNPAPGGGASGAAAFTITAPNPVPTISSLSPTSATSGTAAFTLTVNGTGFIAGSVVNWNGAGRATTYVSGTQLQAAISATDIATAGTAQVTVFNPTPGGGTSGNAAFTITAPNSVPTVSSLSPSSAPAGTAAFTLTVNGTGFIAGSVVNWNGTNRTTTYVSATQVKAAITAADIATAGTAQVTVFNPAPGGGTSGNTAFTITAPGTVTKLQCTPATITLGGTSTCTVTLSQAAPLGGSPVSVSDNNAALAVPASVTVAANSTTGSFTATAGTAGSNQIVTVTAALNGKSATAQITVQPVTGLGYVQSATLVDYWITNTNAISTAFTTHNVTTGNLIAVSVSWNSTTDTIKSITDTCGNTYTIVPATLVKNNSFSAEAAYAKNVTGGTKCTVTATFSNKEACKTILIQEVSGADTTSPLDASIATSTFGLGTDTIKSGPFVTHTNGVYILGVMTSPDQNGAGISAGTGYTEHEYNNTYHVELTSEDQLQTQANSSTMLSFSPATFSSALVIGMAFKPLLVSAAGKVITSNARQQETIPAAQVSQPTGLPADKINVLPKRKVFVLSCTPKTVNAGSSVACELRLSAGATIQRLQVSSSNDQVKIPGNIIARPNQGRLTFQVYIEPNAKRQTAVVTVNAGDGQAEDTMEVLPVSGPSIVVQDQQLAMVGKTMSFAVNAIDSVDDAIGVTAKAIPDGASFDPAIGRFDWRPSVSQVGRHELTFTATNSAGQFSTKRITIDVNLGAPELDHSERPSCSPRAIASLTGKWLTASGDLSLDPSGTTTDLGGTKVKVNGQDVPVLSASSSQVQFLCPPLDMESAVEVVVETPFGATEPLSMVMNSGSPKIFALGVSGQDQGLVSFAGTTEMAISRNFWVPGHPAQPGDEILIWGTGFGTDLLNTPMSVKFGDVQAEVEAVRAVPGHAGVYTAQVRVPVSIIFGNAVPIQLQMIGPDGKLFNSNRVMIAVEEADQ